MERIAFNLASFIGLLALCFFASEIWRRGGYPAVVSELVVGALVIWNMSRRP